MPMLNACGTHRGAPAARVAPVLGQTSAGGEGSPAVVRLARQPATTPSHTGPRPRAHEAVRRSKAVGGSGGGGETQTGRACPFLLLGFGKM
jgi:hypothetical protein